MGEDIGTEPELYPCVPTHSLPLLNGKTTFVDALEEEENMLVRLSYPKQRFDFFVLIVHHEKDFQDVIANHLGLTGDETCRLGEVSEWRHGSFNVCVPVYVENWKTHPGKRLILRIPLPYKAGELTYPGNVDEKIRTEAATFLWIQDHCRDIPIPSLWGFGCPGGQSFMRLEYASFVEKAKWYFRRVLSTLFGLPIPCRYICKTRSVILDQGYMIMDYIEPTEARMLSDTWPDLRLNHTLRTNLFRGLSRIILSLSQIQLPKIGSWTINDQEAIETLIPRDLTYATSDTFYSDILACHDSRIYNQPNSILDEKDGLGQMANLFCMRGLLSHFTSRRLRSGPFAFSLTDLHGPNIFVDDDWNIKYIIDLEWACSLPVEMLAPPHWITDCGVDQLEGDTLETYANAHAEFTKVFEEEEQKCPPFCGSKTYRTDIMRSNWTSGAFWYFHALNSLKGCFNLLQQHIQPRFNQDVNYDGSSQEVFCYWAPNAKQVIATKLDDKTKYEQGLQQLFDEQIKNPSVGNQD
ncbi:hypothetical protein LOZ64_002016 [Ophidiomyces ophidiicola]|nr:hypothetical protein LOZ64_002016 [Ophidiomyces ophidiicola]KAI2007175.1 hypothetical protein LOZ49_004737 [Ophidiomyces ophidiicola]KAI2019073.1 hypothetical protein LOZ46_003447 [Ophidiomyces ophidiicola]KAI2140844.1 hypothetical protein LOZ28_002737 [Ophidiomyces ophidiicola]KAI2211001.1 hypothetical protein LOZ15_005790 [Ophidiomyces ophidiicola]